MFKKDFSQTQWEMNQKQGSQCKECCKTRAENADAEFAKAKAAAKQVLDPAASPTWPSEDKTLAQRWLIEDDRSPASSFAFREPQVLPGHARNQGCAKMDHQASPTRPVRNPSKTQASDDQITGYQFMVHYLKNQVSLICSLNRGLIDAEISKKPR